MKCIDEGYVVISGNDYYQANRGIFRTKRNAEKECNLLKKRNPKHDFQVAKVKLMVVEEE